MLPRELLNGIGPACFVKTSGSKGLHLHVPLDGVVDFDTARALARKVATATRSPPEMLTVEQRKDKRGNRVVLGTGRNAYGQHAVAPYALRPYPEGPVAAPLSWDEALRSGYQPRRSDSPPPI